MPGTVFHLNPTAWARTGTGGKAEDGGRGSGGLSGNQILQGFIILVRRVGYCAQGEEKQVKGLNGERSGQVYILERSLCLDSGGWIGGGERRADYDDIIYSAAASIPFFVSPFIHHEHRRPQQVWEI